MKDVANDIVNGDQIHSPRHEKNNPDSTLKYVLKPGMTFEINNTVIYRSPFNATTMSDWYFNDNDVSHIGSAEA